VPTLVKRSGFVPAVRYAQIALFRPPTDSSIGQPKPYQLRGRPRHYH